MQKNSFLKVSLILTMVLFMMGAVAGMPLEKAYAEGTPTVFISTQGYNYNGMTSSSARAPLDGSLRVGLHMENTGFTDATFKIRYDAGAVTDPTFFDPQREDITSRTIAYNSLADGWREAVITIAGNVNIGVDTSTLFLLRFDPLKEGTSPLELGTLMEYDMQKTSCGLDMSDAGSPISYVLKEYNDELVLFTFTDKDNVNYFADYYTHEPITNGAIYATYADATQSDLGVVSDPFGGYFFNNVPDATGYYFAAPGYNEGAGGYHQTSQISAAMLFADPHMISPTTEDVNIAVNEPGIGSLAGTWNAVLYEEDQNYSYNLRNDKTVSVVASGADQLQLTVSGGLSLPAGAEFGSYVMMLYNNGELYGRVCLCVDSYVYPGPAQFTMTPGVITPGTTLSFNFDLPDVTFTNGAYAVVEDATRARVAGPAALQNVSTGNYTANFTEILQNTGSYYLVVYDGDPDNGGFIVAEGMFDIDATGTNIGGVWLEDSRVSENAQITVGMDSFTGNLADLSLELIYQNPDTQASATVAVLDTVTDNGDGTYTFACSATGVNGLADPQLNNQSVQAALLLQTEVEPIRQYIGYITVDNMGPQEVGFQFIGQDTEGTYAGKYAIKTFFGGDTVDAALLAANYASWFVLESNGVSAAPVGVTMDPLSQEVWEAKLYFDSVMPGDIIKALGLNDVTSGNVVEDTAGHKLQYTYGQPIYLDVHITGTVVDENGNAIPYARVELFNMAALTEELDHDFEVIFTDAGGRFDRFVQQGQYMMLAVEFETAAGFARKGIMETVNIAMNPADPELAQTINIALHPANVDGTVAPDATMPQQLAFIDASLMADINNSYDPQGFMKDFAQSTSVDASGSFSLYLAPGTYQLLGAVSGFSMLPPVDSITGAKIDVLFTVADTGYTFAAPLYFMQENVVGKVVDHTGQPVSEALLFIESLTDPMTEVPALTAPAGDPAVEAGTFAVALPDGSYEISGIGMMEPFDKTLHTSFDGGLYDLNITFDVSGGQVTNIQGITGTSLMDIMLPAPNVEITVTKNGLPQRGFIELIRASEQSNMTTADMEGEELFTGTGTLRCYLSPDTYTITGFESVDSMTADNWTQLEQTFTVAADSDFTGLNAIAVNIESMENVIITLLDETGNPAVNYGLGIEGIGSFTYQWGMTDEYGRAYFQLELGAYRVPGCDVPGADEWTREWRELDINFDVLAQHTTTSPFELTIQLQAPNVSGVVLDGTGNAIPRAWVNVKKLPAAGELYSEYFGFGTDELGHFSTSLEAGTYIVEGVGTPDAWYEMNYKFMVEDGVTYDLTIQKPADNITGHVYRNASLEPYTAQEYQDMGIEIVQMGIAQEQIDMSPWLYRKWIKVNADGTFGMMMQEGLQYRIAAITTPQKYNEFDAASAPVFTVGTDSTGLVIYPPVPNFSGVVQDFNGNPVAGGWISVEKADHTDWPWLPIESDGTFGKALKAGQNYIIREVTYFYADEWDTTINGPLNGAMGHRLNFDREITVGADSQNLVLKPNVKGTLTIDPAKLGDTTGYGAGVIIRPDKDWAEMTEDERMNPWKYERYAGLEVSGSVGTFYAYLDDGDAPLGKSYILAGIPAPMCWIEINEPFVIGTTQQAAYTVDFNLAPNVQGIIQNADGSPIAGVWVDFKEVIADQTALQPAFEKYFGTMTDAFGNFAMKLKPGTYRLNGYNTQGSWDGYTWMPGKWTEVGYKFMVDASGQLTDLSGNPLAQIAIKPNVMGLVQKYYHQGDNLEFIVEPGPVDGQLVTVKNAWLTVKPAMEDFSVNKDDWQNAIWTNTGSDGLFTLMLSPGKYKIVEAGGPEFWMPLDINIQVDGAGNAVAVDQNGIAIPVENYTDLNGRWIIKPEEPNVSGYVYKDGNKTEPLQWGWMAIKPGSYTDWQWDENVRWVEVKEGGYFATKLPDGDWKIAEVNSQNYWNKYDAAFIVTGGQIDAASLGAELTLDGSQLIIAPPTDNFFGEVRDENGSIITENAWITIKPATAGEHDWEGAFGLESSNGSFSGYVKPGNYKIVNVGGMDFWFEVKIPFTVGPDGTVSVDDLQYYEAGTGVIVKQCSPNVSAPVYATVSGQETQLTQGWLGIARYDAGGNQVKMDGQAISADEINPYDTVQWQFTKWFEIKNGIFAAVLDAGSYKVLHVDGQANGMWAGYDPKLDFTVNADGTHTLAAVREPQANVTITIRNASTTAEQGWLDIFAVKPDGSKMFVPVMFNGKTGSDFEFAGYLEQGDYRLQSFGTYDCFNEIKQSFTVTADGAALIIDLAENVATLNTVRGRISNGGQAISEQAWIAVARVIDGVVSTNDDDKKWLQTDNMGQFAFKLAAGETWAVTDVSTSAGYKVISNPAGTAYTVTPDADQSPAQWQIDISQQ